MNRMNSRSTLHQTQWHSNPELRLVASLRVSLIDYCFQRTSTASSLSDSEESWHGIQGAEGEFICGRFRKPADFQVLAESIQDTHSDEERESGSRDEDGKTFLSSLFLFQQEMTG
jgi:hypothetical protein